MPDGVRSFYDEDAKRYDSRWLMRGGERNAQIQGQIAEELTSRWSGDRILEVGPGTGRFSIDLIKCSDSYFAADISGKMLRRTREKLSHLQNPNLGMVEASFISLPFPEFTFDALFSVNVLNHVPDADVALTEISRVLKPGGHFLISFVNLTSYFWPIAFLINRRGTAIGKNVYSKWRRFAIFNSKVRKAGLEVNEIRGNVHIPKWLDLPFARSILSSLDLLSRNGRFAKYAPTIFLSGTRVTG